MKILIALILIAQFHLLCCQIDITTTKSPSDESKGSIFVIINITAKSFVGEVSDSISVQIVNYLDHQEVKNVSAERYNFTISNNLIKMY